MGWPFTFGIESFSIFAVDETDFCNTFSRFSLLAFARDCDCRLLGHEFREHEGAFEPRFFCSTDFHVAVRGDVFFAPCDFAQAFPLRELEARIDFVYLRTDGVHTLFLGGKYGAFDFSVEQRVVDCLHEPAVDHDFWRTHLQERTPLQTADSRLRHHVYRDGARGSERKVYSKAFACRGFASIWLSLHVDGLFADSPQAQRQIFYVVHDAQDVLLRGAFVDSRDAHGNGQVGAVAKFCGTCRHVQLPLPYGILVAVRVSRVEQGP